MSTCFTVIGSNSFSGAHFCDYLINQGHQVLGISRSPEPDPVFLPYKQNRNHQKLFQFYQANLNSDVEKVLALIRDSKSEFIVNFAAQGMVAQSWESPVDWYQTNVVAQVRFHDGLRKLQSLRKYVHVTTPEVYGSTDGWITEHDHFEPSTPYAVSRAACDMHLKSFFHAYKFPVVFTRSANVYGPGQQLYRIIPRALICARTGQKLSLHGGGLSTRCFIHIKDVASATYGIAMNSTAGSYFHISTNKPISIRELVEKLAVKARVEFDDLVEVSIDRLGKDEAYLLNSEKLREELGWTDTVGLDDGIDETLKWLDHNLDTLINQPQTYVHKN